MPYLLLGLILIVAFVIFIKSVSSSDAARLKKIYKYVVIAVGIIVVILLIRLGQPVIAAAFGAIIAIAPYLRKTIGLFYTLRLFKGFLGRDKGKTAPSAKMTRKEACEILEVAESASKKEITYAYKKLMKKNHPDTGGSKYIAGKLNQAKDILLKG